jgi:DNA-binding beta-propeller fold protein YncE
MVVDIGNGKVLHTISGLENPHGVLYRHDLDRIYVTDGGRGLLRIYSGRDYRLLKTVDHLPDADSVGYDAATKYLYVDTASETPGSHESRVSIVDTTRGELIGHVDIPGESPEAMAFEHSSPKMYIDITDQNQVGVLDREKRALIATWSITKGKKNIAIALDEAHHRLFVGCRNTETSGVIVVMDTETGKELETLPIGGWVDDIAYDPPTRRIYASCGAPVAHGGSVYVYEANAKGEYQLMAKVPTAPRAKTSLFVPSLKRLFVAVPHYEDVARVLVYRVP